MRFLVVSIVVVTVGAICLSFGTAIAQDATVDQLQVEVDQTKNKAVGNEGKIETLGKNFQILQDQIDNIQLTPGPPGEPGSPALSITGGILSTSQSEQCVNEECSMKTTVLIAVPENQRVRLEAFSLEQPAGSYVIYKYPLSPENPYPRIEFVRIDVGYGDSIFPYRPIFSSIDSETHDYPFTIFMVTDSLVRLVLDDVDRVKQVISESEGIIVSAEIEAIGANDARLLVFVKNDGAEYAQYILSVSEWGVDFDLQLVPVQITEMLQPGVPFAHFINLHTDDGFPEVYFVFVTLRSLTGKRWVQQPVIFQPLP